MATYQALCLLLHFCYLVSAHNGNSITPLYKNTTACLAENLRMTSKYICDSDGNVICLGGWTDSASLCNKPVCEIEEETCAHGRCIRPNVCACKIGWDGPLCSTCIPMGGCKKGTCNKPMECNCEPGWTGAQCDKPECKGCVNGCCYEPNKCICNIGWKGTNCTECTTLSNCKNGKCINHPFECKCDDGWKGLSCDKPVCRETCHPNYGFCEKPGECRCKLGWTGRDCSECMPSPNCNGTCVNNIPGTCTDAEPTDESLPDQWNKWSPWSSCSKTCGDGVQNRIRKCSPLPGGINGQCVGQNLDTKPCNILNCAIDGGWSKWLRWSLCSTSCGTGTRKRSRGCSNPISKYGGKSCQGSNVETANCFTRSCPVDGRWSSWQAWGQCSVTCGTGETQRRRKCNSPTPAHDGAFCLGNQVQSKSCFAINCPIDGKWLEWSFWSKCSRTCGRGTRERKRFCDPPKFGGKKCFGTNSTETEVAPCWEQQVCAIDGGWANWETWTECTATCGNGVKLRRRKCSNPSPQFGGKLCKGDKTQTESCTKQDCQTHGTWALWTQWSSCSATCNGGNQTRTRECTLPKPSSVPCRGVPFDKRLCNIQSCPLATWGEWQQWGVCSKTCGTGNRVRQRTCLAGQQCIGQATEISNCNQNSCQTGESKWSEWNQWSLCSQTCGEGFRDRGRFCQIGAFGQSCIGQASEINTCNDGACQTTESKWLEWNQWTICSHTCGGGIRNRNRLCELSSQGQQCNGKSGELERCNEQTCQTPGSSWLQWAQWSICSKTCGTGIRQRSRNCLLDSLEQDCIGQSVQSETCEEQICQNRESKWEQWKEWSACSLTCGSGVQRRVRYCERGSFLQECIGQFRELRVCNTQSCILESNWSPWSPWSSCSSTCGFATQSKFRQCLGTSCTGENTETQQCGLPDCPPEANWSLWSAWSSCSATCGFAMQTRNRQCIGANCFGVSDENQQCELPDCPINGGLSEWTIWSDCTVVCLGDRGNQARRRFCNNPAPTAGGAGCNAVLKEKRYCTGIKLKQETNPEEECFFIGNKK